MAEQSERMGFPFPSKNRDSYYNDFLAFVRALDSSGFAAREDRNFFFLSTGNFSFDAGSGLLTWSLEIDIFVPNTGTLLIVPSGSASLADGQVLWVDLVRGSTVGGVISANVGSVVPSSDTARILAFRFGSVILFANGRILADGETGPVLSVSSLGGSGGSPSPAYSDFGATSVLDLAYISAADTLAQADATAIATAPAVGFVSAKPTVNTARLQTSGELAGFVGLTPGALYYLDQVPGQITLTPPALPGDAGSGKIVQRVGRARNATTLLIQIDPDFLIL